MPVLGLTFIQIGAPITQWPDKHNNNGSSSKRASSQHLNQLSF